MTSKPHHAIPIALLLAAAVPIARAEMYGAVPLTLPGRPPSYHGPLYKFVPPGEDVPDNIGVPTEQGPLTSVNGDVKPSVGNVAFYDFGNLSAAVKRPIRHDFLLRNTSNQSINIDRVEGGCGCTTAKLDLSTLGPDGVVKPGQIFKVHVEVDTRQLYVGKINKLVFVYLKGSSKAAFAFHIIGTITPLATFEPSLIDLGKVRPGSQWNQPLTVDVDTRVYGPHPPNPFSLNNSVVLSRDAQPAGIHNGYLRRTYRVEVSRSAHIGPIDTVVAMPLADKSGKPGPSVIVSGSISGDLTAFPTLIALGEVKAGTTASQEIQVSTSTPGALRDLKLKPASTSIDAVIEKQRGKSAFIRVRLQTRKAGAFTSKVTVISQNGDQIDVPVYAWIAP
jgi:hypothetical protein